MWTHRCNFAATAPLSRLLKFLLVKDQNKFFYKSDSGDCDSNSIWCVIVLELFCSWRFQRTVLDLTLQWRFANLPNNAKLEMVTSSRKQAAAESQVSSHRSTTLNDNSRDNGTWCLWSMSLIHDCDACLWRVLVFSSGDFYAWLWHGFVVRVCDTFLCSHQVRIALQMEDGSRLQDSFCCGQSLWELITHFPPIRCVTFHQIQLC